MDGRERFLAALQTIERIVGAIVRSRRLDADDADDFASFVNERLIANDYAILEKFGGRSSLNTYLTVVINRLFLDFRNARWGRWRPSAAARRMGSWAVRLETLISRDGRTTDEAVGSIRTAFPESPDEAQLRAMAARLPARTPSARSVELRDDGFAADDEADGRVHEAERDASRQRMLDALHDGLALLPAEDRLILQLRFWQNLSVADIARTLRLEQKPLYRRIASNLARLREELDAAGFGTGALADWEVGE